MCIYIFLSVSHFFVCVCVCNNWDSGSTAYKHGWSTVDYHYQYVVLLSLMHTIVYTESACRLGTMQQNELCGGYFLVQL